MKESIVACAQSEYDKNEAKRSDQALLKYSTNDSNVLVQVECVRCPYALQAGRLMEELIHNKLRKSEVLLLETLLVLNIK